MASPELDDITSSVVEYQNTRSERALDRVAEWAIPRMTAMARSVAKQHGVAHEELEGVGGDQLRTWVEQFDLGSGHGPRGFAPYFHARLRHALDAAARSCGRLGGETSHTVLARGYVLRAERAVAAQTRVATARARAVPIPPAPDLPPLDVAFWNAVRAGASVSERSPLYAALPRAFAALAAYLTGALPEAPAGDVVALVRWCVVHVFTPRLRAAVLADLVATPFPPVALLKADAAGISPPDAAPPGRVTGVEGALRAAAADARVRYLTYGTVAARSPGNEFWVDVGSRAGVSARQAQALFASRGTADRLDAVGPARASDVGEGRAVFRLPAGSEALEAPSDDGEEDDARAAREARAARAFALLRPECRVALVWAYRLFESPLLATLLEGAWPGHDDVVPLRLSRPALARGQRALGAGLWVLVRAANLPRRAWRRHPAQCVARHTMLLLKSWESSRAAPPAARGDSAGRGAQLTAIEPSPSVVVRNVAVYEMPAELLARALRRVGLGALDRGRRAAQARTGGQPTAVLTLGAPAGEANILVLRVEHDDVEITTWVRARAILGPTPACTAPVDAPPRDPDTSAAFGVTPPDVSLLGSVDARAFSAALRDLARAAVVRVARQLDGVSLSTDDGAVLLAFAHPARLGGTAGHPDVGAFGAVPDRFWYDHGATGEPLRDVAVATAVAGGFVARGAALIRAALRVAPITAVSVGPLATSERAAREGADRRLPGRRSGAGRGTAVLAIGEGGVLTMSGGENVWALYETLAGPPGSSPGSPGPTQWLCVRLSGRIFSNLPDLFAADDLIAVAYTAGTLVLTGPGVHVRTPVRPVEPPAAWAVSLAGERHVATVDARALAAALREASRQTGVNGAVRPPMLRLEAGGDDHGVVPTTLLQAIVGALPGSFARLSRADLVTRHGTVPVLVVRPEGTPGTGHQAARVDAARPWIESTTYMVRVLATDEDVPR